MKLFKGWSLIEAKKVNPEAVYRLIEMKKSIFYKPLNIADPFFCTIYLSYYTFSYYLIHIQCNIKLVDIKTAFINNANN